jgi:hypothetical protein
MLHKHLRMQKAVHLFLLHCLAFWYAEWMDGWKDVFIPPFPTSAKHEEQGRPNKKTSSVRK